ncbi:MAG: chlorite dismutase family protein [Miltoncostaeaceae bacterium]
MESADGVRPSEGRGVVHLLLSARRGEAGASTIVEAVEAFRAAPDQQVIAFSVLGSDADLGLMALGPDLDALDLLTKAVLVGPVDPVDSFVSLTERSEYTSTEDDERARLEAAGETPTDEALAAWRDRMEKYADARLHPDLPDRKLIAFYPMSKTRLPDANWYELTFEERKRLMQGHARIGRGYAGRVLQLITGSTGLDDWEWGVTLLADDPAVIKEIVYEMRFDPVSARYGAFGPFWVGLVMDVREALQRSGIT